MTDFSLIPSVLTSLSAHYCLFLAVDASSLSSDTILETARSLLKSGAVYLCIWGPDCERVHDLFDEERMPDEPDGQLVITTWHADEPLCEALWFFSHCVKPDDGFTEDCVDWIAVSVAQTGWAREIREGLIEDRLV